MGRFVRRKNIEHYQEMLKARSDPARRELKNCWPKRKRRSAKRKNRRNNFSNRFVRFGSNGRALSVRLRDIRFPSKADIVARRTNVCFMPIADMADHSILQRRTRAATTAEGGEC